MISAGVMKELPHTHSCYVCGESNPLGLQLRFETDGRLVRTRFRPRPEHAGFKGVVHGGIVATVLDEIMVWACAVSTKRFAYCAELNVRYQQPLKPGSEYVVTGELATDRRGRIYEAKASVADETGLVLVDAAGKYLPIKAASLADMVGDIVGDASWLRAS